MVIFCWEASLLRDAQTLSENELNTVVATMSYEGKTYDITAQEAIEATSTLDAMKNDDGTYNMLLLRVLFLLLAIRFCRQRLKKLALR